MSLLWVPRPWKNKIAVTWFLISKVTWSITKEKKIITYSSGKKIFTSCYFSKALVSVSTLVPFLNIYIGIILFWDLLFSFNIILWTFHHDSKCSPMTFLEGIMCSLSGADIIYAISCCRTCRQIFISTIIKNDYKEYSHSWVFCVYLTIISLEYILKSRIARSKYV